jgi:hypothetical protein
LSRLVGGERVLVWTGRAAGVGDHEPELAAGGAGELVAALDPDLWVMDAEPEELVGDGLARRVSSGSSLAVAWLETMKTRRTGPSCTLAKAQRQ